MSFNAGKKRYTLLEPRVEVALRDIWATAPTVPRVGAQLPLPEPTTLLHDDSQSAHDCPTEETTTSKRLGAFAMESEEDNRMFSEEKREADLELCHWIQYVKVFRSTFGRRPVLYDLFCGEGTFARGAVAAGCEVHGFDWMTKAYTFGKATQPRTGQSRFERAPIPTMHFHQQDLEDERFWHHLGTHGHVFFLPWY